MTKQEYLLICLAEECAEIQKEVSKALRFGLADCSPEKPQITNRTRIEMELTDLKAILELLELECSIDLKCEWYLKEKINKVKKYMSYSEKLGILDKKK